MSDIFNLATIANCSTILMLLLTIHDMHKKANEKRRQILEHLRTFKFRLEYTAQEKSEVNMALIQNEMIKYLYMVKSTVFLSSFSNPFKYEEEIFSMACQKFPADKEGVTFEDVICSVIGLTDVLIQFLGSKL